MAGGEGLIHHNLITAQRINHIIDTVIGFLACTATGLLLIQYAREFCVRNPTTFELQVLYRRSLIHPVFVERDRCVYSLSPNSLALQRLNLPPECFPLEPCLCCAAATN